MRDQEIKMRSKMRSKTPIIVGSLREKRSKTPIIVGSLRETEIKLARSKTPIIVGSLREACLGLIEAIESFARKGIHAETKRRDQRHPSLLAVFERLV
jgi:hypothetical protein